MEIQPSPDLLFKTQDDLVREMGQDGVSDQLLGRFAPFLLQWYSLLNLDDSYKNDTNQVVGGEIWENGGER